MEEGRQVEKNDLPDERRERCEGGEVHRSALLKDKENVLEMFWDACNLGFSPICNLFLPGGKHNNIDHKMKSV